MYIVNCDGLFAETPNVISSTLNGFENACWSYLRLLVFKRL